MRLLAAIAATLLIAAGSAVTAARAARVVVIKVKSVGIAGTYTVNDVTPKGPSKGDRYFGRDHLVNTAPQFGRKVGAVVGTDWSTLTLTGAKTGCVNGVAELPGGTIRFEGCGRLGVNVPVPVTGGSGVYADARGTTVAGPGTSPINTYRLTLP